MNQVSLVYAMNVLGICIPLPWYKYAMNQVPMGFEYYPGYKPKAGPQGERLLPTNTTAMQQKEEDIAILLVLGFHPGYATDNAF